MAVSIPDRNTDQVKVAGATLPDIVEHRENIDGGLTKAERAATQGNSGRVHDHGVSEKDFVAQSAQRALRQFVRVPGGSPGLVLPEKVGGLLFPTEETV